MWRPTLPASNLPKYAALAEALRRDIASGLLTATERLPPQRELAGALGLTVPTVTRAYALAARRGLITATVGRGTFVRGPLLAADDGGVLDLSINTLPPHAHRGELASRLEWASEAEHRARLLDYPPHAGRAEHREAGARWFAMRGIEVAPSRVLVTAGPTLEDIDPVRFIGNRSSGRMGFALAAEAHRVVHCEVPCRPCTHRDCPIGHPCAAASTSSVATPAACALLERHTRAPRTGACAA